MTVEIIDVFCHFLPPRYVAALKQAAPTPPFMFERACAMPAMVNEQARLAVIDSFPGYRQIPSLTSPPVESIASRRQAAELARIANDEFADLVCRHPAQFASFVATLPLNDENAALAEMERAVGELGAAGVQIFTTVNGAPVDRPGTLRIVEQAALLGCAVWLHPIRAMDVPDYRDEPLSKFDLWWAFGWPHESSLAMGRLVFAGVFDRHPDLKIITHHAGGTVALMAGRVGPGLDLLGSRTPPQHADAVRTSVKERPLAAFRRFHADTATFGSAEAIRCGAEFFGLDKIVFASDMPFDPEGGRGFIRDTLAAIDRCGFSAAEREAILAGNARRILKLGTSVPAHS